MKYTQYILFCLLALGATTLSAQGLSIQTKIDRTEIKTGEQAVIDLTIRTNNLPETKFFLKQDSTQQSERFRVLYFAPTDTTDISGDIKEIQAKMVITSFDSTLVVIPPILVQTPSEQAESQPLALNVVQPKVDMEHPDRFNGLKDVWDTPMTKEEIIRLALWIALGLFIVMVIISICMYIRDKRRHKVDIELPSAQPPLSPLEQLHLQLKNIPTDSLLTQEDFKAYYTAIIDCLKLYIQSVKPWSMQELTTKEILDFFREQGLPITLIHQFSSIAGEADLVKFAKGSSTQEHALEVRENALIFAQGFDLLVHPKSNE